jgi:predicted CoA-binding protein
MPTDDDQLIRRLLSLRRWAVVGASTNPAKASNHILSYLRERGYTVYPVNPVADEIDGHTAYKDLKSLPEPPDVVDLFRRPELIGPHVEEAIEAGAKAVWTQLEIVNEEAAARAREAGLLVVMDRCPMREIPRLDFVLEEGAGTD